MKPNCYGHMVEGWKGWKSHPSEGERGDPKGFLEELEFKLGGWEKKSGQRQQQGQRPSGVPPGPRYSIYYPGTGPQVPERETEPQGRLEGTKAGHQPGDWLSPCEQ